MHIKWENVGGPNDWQDQTANNSPKSGTFPSVLMGISAVGNKPVVCRSAVPVIPEMHPVFGVTSAGGVLMEPTHTKSHPDTKSPPPVMNTHGRHCVTHAVCTCAQTKHTHTHIFCHSHLTPKCERKQQISKNHKIQYLSIPPITQHKNRKIVFGLKIFKEHSVPQYCQTKLANY